MSLQFSHLFSTKLNFLWCQINRKLQLKFGLILQDLEKIYPCEDVPIGFIPQTSFLNSLCLSHNIPYSYQKLKLGVIDIMFVLFWVKIESKYLFFSFNHIYPYKVRVYGYIRPYVTLYYSDRIFLKPTVYIPYSISLKNKYKWGSHHFF